MPDSKITALTSISTSTDPANDPLVIVDVSDTSMAATGTTKKVTLNQLLGASGTATLASATISGDLTVRTNMLAVTSAGVGFGTTTPAYPAHFRTTSPVIAIQDDTSAATGVGGTMNFLGFTSGTSGANIFAQIKGVKTAGSAGGEYQVFTSDSAGNSVQRYRIDSTGVSTWSVAGSTAMTLNATGLGVGVASPSARLHVKSTNGLLINESTGDVTGAGTTFLSLVDANGQAGYYGFAGDGSSSLSVWNKKSGSLLFATGNTLRATIDSTGNVLVGTTNTSATAGVGFKSQFSSTVPQFAIVVNEAGTSSSLSIYNVNAAAYRFYVNNGGTVFATNTTISAISDARLKENVQDIDVGLGAILALKPRKFDWKAGKGKDIKGDRGFIAQEFEQVFPNLIDEWKDEAPEGEAPYKSVRQDLIPVLVKAIQELTARVQTLETR